MRPPTLVALVTALSALAAFPACRGVSAADSSAAARLGDIVLVPDGTVLSGAVPPRTTIAGLLMNHDIAAADVTALVASVGSAFDVRKLRAGQPYLIDKLNDGRVRGFEYEIDGDRRLVARRAESDARAPRFVTAVDAIPKQVAVVAIEGRIDRDANSLSAALSRAGERIDLALGLAEVFSGEIDFNSDLQPGDSFRLVVERQQREGALAGYGPILAAEFVNDGRRLRAVRFTPANGSPGYYDERGRSLKRFFLKSPLKFEPRVTSRFSSARMHPLLGYTRAHNGVDYHAPSGAPVASVAPGVVTLAGWTNGGGRTVRVRHSNGYESEYLHLSAITVHTGQRIGQSDLIGRVGATGLATGPHLHYGLRKNGGYVNPIREHQNMPPGEPVPSALLTDFTAERDHWLAMLTGTSPARAAND